MSANYDLIIVGGGLAGSALARSMATGGARVLILEREQQFKDRVRGEFITSWGVAETQALEIYDLLTENVGHKIPWVDFYSGPVLVNHRDMVATTPTQLPCLAFYHPAMQEVLLSAASDAGAEVRRGITVGEVRTGAFPTVAATSQGLTQDFRARLVVGADGRNSVVRKCAGFQVQRDPDFNVLAGIVFDNVPVPDDTSHLVINSELGQAAVIFPQGHGRARTYFCYHHTQPRLQGPGAIPLYIEKCKRAGMNSSFYDGVEPAGPLASFDGAHTWVNHPYRDGLALVGDAASASDPSWGQGLGTTLRDIRILRDQLLANGDWDAAGHAYAAEHDRCSRAIQRSNNWYTQLFLETGPEADARRARAMPLIAQDPTRQPDTLFSGPDISLTEEVRKRFFAEE